MANKQQEESPNSKIRKKTPKLRTISCNLHFTKKPNLEEVLTFALLFFGTECKQNELQGVQSCLQSKIKAEPDFCRLFLLLPGGSIPEELCAEIQVTVTPGDSEHSDTLSCQTHSHHTRVSLLLTIKSKLS